MLGLIVPFSNPIWEVALPPLAREECGVMRPEPLLQANTTVTVIRQSNGETTDLAMNLTLNIMHLTQCGRILNEAKSLYFTVFFALQSMLNEGNLQPS
jgi:hypothetical protein